MRVIGRPHLLRVLKGHGVTSVAFNADGTMLVSAAKDGKIRLWEVATGICDDER